MSTKRAVEEVGLLGYVVCEKRLSDITSIMILNDVGGSSWLPPGRYKVRVVHGFDDYETGRNLHGELVDEKDIAIARKAGTTGYAKKAKNARKGLELIDRDQKEFNPKKVYFRANYFQPERTAKEFKVASVSENRNSFGLRGMILVARDGEAWQVAANNLNEKKKGEILKVPSFGGKVDFSYLEFEIPERVVDAPPGVVEEVWGKKKGR